MHAYILEDENEVTRLEKQNIHRLYSIEEELRLVEIKNNIDLLDAGCGTGAVTRYVLEHCKPKTMTAMDFSEIRLREMNKILRKNHPNSVIEFKHFDLMNENFEGSEYDHVISRFVMHHLVDPQKAIFKLTASLRNDGKLTIIDSDGILFNIYSGNKWLDKKLHQLKDAMEIDFYVGRRLKFLMGESGLTDLQSRVIPMHFCGVELELERDQYAERFCAMKGFLKKALGDRDAAKFVHQYLDALSKPSTELFYNKFITQGRKI